MGCECIRVHLNESHASATPRESAHARACRAAKRADNLFSRTRYVTYFMRLVL